jgi:hypothetical protein
MSELPAGTCPAELLFWSRSAASAAGAHLDQPAPQPLALSPDSRFHRARLRLGATGTAVLRLTCPRPLRLWIGPVPAVDESLLWRLFNRQLQVAVLWPAAAGEVELLVEVGPRPRHPAGVDLHSPSRHRQAALAAVASRLPDVLGLEAWLVPGVVGPAASLRFTPTQYQRDGVTYQQTWVRPLSHWLRAPGTEQAGPPTALREGLALRSSVLPGQAVERTDDEDRLGGRRRFFVPVAGPKDDVPPLRALAKEERPEPLHGIARHLLLTVEGAAGAVAVPMPAFESTGRLAPRREYRRIVWPEVEALRRSVPRPVLPVAQAHFLRLYDAAWDMFVGLVRDPGPDSGAACPYVATGAGFGLYQFVWDSAFTAMCMAYGWRALDPHANLDNLYTRQFDGGYLHREHWWGDGLPHLYEPDFSPNPPLVSVAEWQLARLTGDALRLHRVYPALAAQHAWLRAHRRLPDGTYWTTGLANGLDNSPSLGEGYPCLSAQMAHEAQILAGFAARLGDAEAAAAYATEHRQLAAAINERLWSDRQSIYATSLAGGGHNPNKVVTAFWPLWADVVPPERVVALAAHLKDPRSFWRHHPVPSLAADSPHYRAEGEYWLGSTWAPTNYATVQGFARAGRLDLARETTVRHLQCMCEVFDQTGRIWENYAPDASRPGSLSGAPYCWSALGPIALLLEVLVGVEPDALSRRIRWQVPDLPGTGVSNYPLGPATVSLVRSAAEAGRLVEIHSDLPFTLELVHQGRPTVLACAAGSTQHRLEALPTG